MKKLAFLSIIALTASAIYLYAWPTPSLFYAALVLFHTALGVVFCVAALRLVPLLRREAVTVKLSAVVLGAGSVLGLILIRTGTTRPHARLLALHIVISGVAVVILAAVWLSRRQGMGRMSWATLAGMFVAALAIAAGARYSRNSWSKQYVIANPTVAPLAMDDEGDGAKGPFFPSSSQVAGNRKIPAKYFMESDACQRCHQDIYKQWQSSAHHFSSFNNQWYRKAIEYMQDVNGVRPSKWCAGCHDPALLYSGMMDTPIKQIIDRPETRAGLGCMMCHSITKVKSTMGQADFVLDYPELHELAASKNPAVRWLHDFSIKLNPEAHRRVFLKPFMQTQTPEFCSSCHKVHLDVPVNNYRWFRGFNEYDNWQASGVSGLGARSFYYPPRAQGCQDCHMPQVASSDMGNLNGKIHSHSFPGANTALPTANEDSHQMELEQTFLKSGVVSLDIFALSKTAPMEGSAVQSAELQTAFGVGEEAEMKTTGEATGSAAPVTAPLDKVNAAVRRGDSVRVDVVVRTRKVGHFFPGGTVDAPEVWIELKATDDRNKVLFWSGKVDGDGQIDPGAHFYRSLQIDEHGNPINKRNAWATRSVVYVRLIPPGAADTAHFRLQVPDDAGSKIKLEARLCYRKFSWYNTHFSYGGVSAQDPSAPHTTPAYDDRQFTFDSDLSRVSGNLKQIPDLPIVTLAEDTVDLRVLPKGAPEPPSKAVAEKEEWTRWNDYGIGLFLQGDLKGAAAAFQHVAEADPDNPDGWVNLGRVAVQEGDMERAREVLQKALAIKPHLARANYFYARVLRTDGDYDGALAHLKTVLAQYPTDRVVLNEYGRVLFLQRKYGEAIAQLQQALAVDPEDLQANYNMMLCYKGLGQNEKAAHYEKLYLRFKADESAQTITGPYRRLHPEDNNERQSIHEHVSAPLAPAKRMAARLPAVTTAGEGR